MEERRSFRHENQLRKVLLAVRNKICCSRAAIGLLFRFKRNPTLRTETRNELLYKNLASFKPVVDAIEQNVLELRNAAQDFLSCTHRTLISMPMTTFVSDTTAEHMYKEQTGSPSEDDGNELTRCEAEERGQSNPALSSRMNDEDGTRSPTRQLSASATSKMDLELVRWELDSCTMRSVIIPIARWKGSFEDLQDRMASLRRYENEYEVRKAQVRRYDMLVERARSRYIKSEKDGDGRKLQQVAKAMRRKEIRFEASKVAFEIMEKDLFDTQRQLLDDCKDFRTYLEKMITLQSEAFSAAATSLGIAPAASSSPTNLKYGHHADSPTSDSSLAITKTPSSRASLLPLPPHTAASATKKASFRAAFKDPEKNETASGHVVVGGRVLILHEEGHREAESAASCATELPAKAGVDYSPPVRSSSPSQPIRKDGAMTRSPLSEIKSGREGTRQKQAPAADGKENLELAVAI